MTDIHNLGYQLSLLNKQHNTELTAEYVAGNMFTKDSIPFNLFINGWKEAREGKTV